MEDLYKRIEDLCKEKGVTITEMCRESGANRASLTDLKKGRKQGLSADTLSKIATYFNVTVDYLLGAEAKKAPIDEDEREIDDHKIKAAFLGGLADGLSDEEIDGYWEDARNYIGYKIQQKKNKKGQSS